MVTEREYFDFYSVKIMFLSVHFSIEESTYPGWNCMNFLQVFVGYQATFS